jgi:hypothetical protein
VKLLLGALLIVGIVRFGLLAYGGYREGRVKSAALWGPYYDRQAQPYLFWMLMAANLFAMVMFTACVAALIFGWAPISS